jgi:hypothetical protein
VAVGKHDVKVIGLVDAAPQGIDDRARKWSAEPALGVGATPSPVRMGVDAHASINRRLTSREPGAHHDVDVLVSEGDEGCLNGSLATPSSAQPQSADQDAHVHRLVTRDPLRAPWVPRPCHEPTP